MKYTAALQNKKTNFIFFHRVIYEMKPAPAFTGVSVGRETYLQPALNTSPVSSSSFFLFVHQLQQNQRVSFLLPLPSPTYFSTCCINHFTEHTDSNQKCIIFRIIFNICLQTVPLFKRKSLYRALNDKPYIYIYKTTRIKRHISVSADVRHHAHGLWLQ